MKPQTLRRILAGAVLLLVGVAWLFLGNLPPTSQRLPDGSTVSLLGVTYGRKHVMVYGPSWQRPLASLLPDKVSRRLGFEFLSHTTTNDTLMVWTEVTNESILPGSPLFFQPAPVVLSDGEGTEFRETLHRAAAHFTNRVIKGTSFSMVPRGSERLRVLVAPYKQEDGVKQTAAFNILNPIPRLQQSWQAPPLPIEANAGDLKFLLTRLRPWQREENSSTGIDIETWMTANYRFSEGGTTTTNWRVLRVEVFDEAGGHYQPVAFSTDSVTTRNHFDFRAGLGTNAVWKVRFALARVDGFPSNEVWVVRDFPLGGGVRKSQRVSTNMLGGTFVLEERLSVGRTLNIYAASQDRDFHLRLLRAADDRGSDVILGNSTRSGVGGLTFGFSDRNGAMSLDLSFGITRLVYVELLVRPEPPFKYSPLTSSASAK